MALLGWGVQGGAPMSAPLARAFAIMVLTESWDFDSMNRRAGGTSRPQKEVGHGDAHKYCPLGRCGTRAGPYSTAASAQNWRSRKIVAWRKAKAQANRRYLEEYVYAKA